MRLKETKVEGAESRQNMDNFFTFTVQLKYLFNSCLVEFHIHMKWHFVSVSFKLLLGFLSCLLLWCVILIKICDQLRKIAMNIMVYGTVSKCVIDKNKNYCSIVVLCILSCGYQDE